MREHSQIFLSLTDHRESSSCPYIFPQPKKERFLLLLLFWLHVRGKVNTHNKVLQEEEKLNVGQSLSTVRAALGRERNKQEGTWSLINVAVSYTLGSTFISTEKCGKIRLFLDRNSASYTHASTRLITIRRPQRPLHTTPPALTFLLTCTFAPRAAFHILILPTPLSEMLPHV